MAKAKAPSEKTLRFVTKKGRKSERNRPGVKRRKAYRGQGRV